MDKHRHVILCVDDEENPLVLRKLVLQKAGYEVITANSAETALQIAASHSIDLVLSDHLMPGTTGAQLARQLKTHNPKLPVVLLSGMNEIPPDAGSADLFLSKVEGPDHMCAEITSVLSSVAAQRSRQ